MELSFLTHFVFFFLFPIMSEPPSPNATAVVTVAMVAMVAMELPDVALLPLLMLFNRCRCDLTMPPTTGIGKRAVKQSPEFYRYVGVMIPVVSSQHHTPSGTTFCGILCLLIVQKGKNCCSN